MQRGEDVLKALSVLLRWTYLDLGMSEGSPYPAVDWDSLARLTLSRLSGSMDIRLPHPIGLSVLACEPGPIQDVELDHLREERVSKTYNPMGCKYTPPTYWHPFGSIDGFRTNLGSVTFPRGPVKGHIWDKEEHRWVLHACPPGQRRRGLRGPRR